MESWHDILEILFKEMEHWLKAFVKLLPNMVVALLVLFAFLFLAKVVRRFLTDVLEKFSDNRAVNGILGTAIYCLLVAVGIFVGLGILQLDKTVTSLLAGAGVIGIALGFAFQEIASNFLAGIFIAFMRPFSVGDIVELDGHVGVINRIDIRTTSLTTFDDLEVIIPNKEMFTKTLKNYTTTAHRRVNLKVGVSYKDDLRQVKTVVRQCLDSLPHRARHKEIEVNFNEFGDSSINMQVEIWINYPGDANYAKTIDEAIIRIKESFDQAGITIPFPVRTLDVDPRIFINKT